MINPLGCKMTNPKNPESRYLTDDYPVVIFYAHVSAEEAMTIANHDIGDIKEDYGNITNVNHWWVQYQRVGEDDLPSCEDGIEAGDIVLVVKETTVRPKGVVSKITVPVFDGWG